MSVRRAVSARRALFVPAALALGASLTLTACGPDGGDAAQPAKPARSASAAAPAAPAGDAAQPTAGAPAPAAGAPSSARPKTPVAPATAGGGAAGTDEAYAYTHSCKADKLTVKVTTRAGSPDQRVIEVHNQGSTYCGLSYYPLVNLGSSKAPDHGNDLTPLVPGGLGGPPAHALAPGKSTYAVVDLNPGSGSVADVDQLNVLADDQMPNSDTRTFQLGAGAKVGKQPKVGLYRDNVADAASSTETAGRS
ncbi:DUF4232 domain-containing protein [Kitasatospora sp. NPDC096204]|uniref:DUF4232 domain-containing protein n=1 Tax=Kitasatospora sp. NPDC096204 TaxID=3364094 RepID=UPI0037F38CDC